MLGPWVSILIHDVTWHFPALGNPGQSRASRGFGWALKHMESEGTWTFFGHGNRAAALSNNSESEIPGLITSEFDFRTETYPTPVFMPLPWGPQSTGVHSNQYETYLFLDIQPSYISVSLMARERLHSQSCPHPRV